ncbi:hypothetical protein [Enhygromyxa salina]|nr:hypothetical protein [Enhygromyxa salina]
MQSRSARFIALTVALGLGLAPIGRASAASPNPGAEGSPSDGHFIVVSPEPEPEPGLGDAELLDPTDASAPIEVDPQTAPAPIFEAQTADVTIDAGPRVVDSKRPHSGSGLIALGTLGVAGSLAMAVAGMAGPGWFEVDRKQALAIGLSSLPVGLFSATMLADGARANKKYRNWVSRNQLQPPNTGTGMMIGGAVAAVTFAVPTVITAQTVIRQSDQDIEEWIPTALLGSFSLAGVALLAGGMFRRSQFTIWERTGYLMPGTMALKGGGGLSISGRF